METNIKQERSKNIIITILIIMIVGLAGLMCYDKFIVKKESEKPVSTETKKEETKKETTVYSVDDPKISKLIDKLIVGMDCDIIEQYTNNKKIEAKDVTNLRAYHIAEINDFYESKKNTITLEEMNKAIWKYLGADYKFDPTLINYKGETCPQYNYDKNTKTFKKQETACGNICGPHTLYKIVKAIEEDGILKLDTKVIFAKDAFYSDYAKTNKIGEFEGNFDSLYEKGSTYQFTFKLVDGNYVFVSSEKI